MPPEPSACLAAFSAVREWTTALAVPEKPRDLVPVPASCITLHFMGDVVGRGVDAEGGSASIWRAARIAIAEAERKLPVAKDALESARRKELAGQVTVTLELAGPLAPLREPTYDAIDDAVSPGLYGLAARSGTTLRVVFPLEAMLNGVLPGQAAATLLGQALGDPAKALRVDPNAQPEKIAKRDGVVLSKFSVAQVGQAAPRDPGLFLARGARAVQIADISAWSLTQMGEGLAAHLRGRLRPDKGGTPRLAGPYFPLRGVHEPALAGSIEEAMAAAALAGWGRRDKLDRASRDAAAAIVKSMFDKAAPADPAGDPRSAAAAMLALTEAVAAGAPPVDPEASARCIKALDGASIDMAGFVAMALSTTRTEQQRAGQILDALYRPNADGQPPDLANHAPWLILAERNLGGGSVRDAAVAPLRAFRDKVYSYVLTAQDAGEENADLAGGVVFPGSRPPLPTAQSLRVISALAMLLADPKVTPDDEFSRELVRFMPCLRFTRQLCADEWTAGYERDPLHAKWGVRASLWDWRMPGEASSLALITVKETLSALDRRTK